MPALLLAALLALATPPPAAPVYFESRSPLTDTFHGPLSAPEESGLPFAYEVRRTKGRVAVTVHPERRIAWTLHLEDGRPTRKEITVAGKPWSTCRYPNYTPIRRW